MRVADFVVNRLAYLGVDTCFLVTGYQKNQIDYLNFLNSKGSDDAILYFAGP